jgi:hypothetical protein
VTRRQRIATLVLARRLAAEQDHLNAARLFALLKISCVPVTARLEYL